jgi:hypothetical protein
MLRVVPLAWVTVAALKYGALSVHLESPGQAAKRRRELRMYHALIEPVSSSLQKLSGRYSSLRTRRVYCPKSAAAISYIS